jgi:hypothetical protein
VPTYVRIDVTAVTPRTAPPYVLMTYTERNSRYVLLSDDGSGKLLVGPMGVNYFEDGKPTLEGIYLHRWDQPPGRARRSRSGHDSWRTKGKPFHRDL